MYEVSGQKIKQRRKSLQLSQEALAEKLGVSKVTICWYESGERTPSLENFLKLSDALDLSLDELVGREVDVVSEEDGDYKVRLPKRDLEIISNLKEYPDVYNKLYEDPSRVAKLIDKKMK